MRILTKLSGFDGMKVPSKPHILEEQPPITEAEVENRMRVARELENLGISTSKFDIADEHEDTDVLQAIILINQGKSSGGFKKKTFE